MSSKGAPYGTAQVHQASGMVSAQASCTPAEALVLMETRAVQIHLTLAEIAVDCDPDFGVAARDHIQPVRHRPLARHRFAADKRRDAQTRGQRPSLGIGQTLKQLDLSERFGPLANGFIALSLDPCLILRGNEK